MYTYNAPPDIDNAVSTFEEFLGLMPEMNLYALSCRGKCLVNMDTLLRKKMVNA